MTEIFKVLSDENRLRILNVLMKYSLCVCELEVVLNMTQSNVSRHLSILKNIGLVSSSKDAQWIHYTFNEAFSNDNELLAAYLKQKFAEGRVYLNDYARCKAYKESEYNCQTIRSDKNFVMEYIIGKVKNLGDHPL